MQRGQQRHRLLVQKGTADAPRQGEILLKELLHGEGEQLPPLLGRVDMDQGRRERRTGEVHIVPGRQLLRPVHPALQQPGEKEAAQHRQTLLIAIPQGLLVLPLRPFGVQLLLELLQHRRKLRGVDGLEDVLRDVHPHRLLGVLKIVKAGEHHELGPRQPLGQNAAQLQPVHKGHLDIRQDHVRLHGLRQFQGVPAVFRLAHQFKSQAAPVHFPTDAHPDVLLVIHQQHLIEAHVFSHPFLRQYSTLPLDWK